MFLISLLLKNITRFFLFKSKSGLEGGGGGVLILSFFIASNVCPLGSWAEKHLLGELRSPHSTGASHQWILGQPKKICTCIIFFLKFLRHPPGGLIFTIYLQAIIANFTIKI